MAGGNSGFCHVPPLYLPHSFVHEYLVGRGGGGVGRREEHLHARGRPDEAQRAARTWWGRPPTAIDEHEWFGTATAGRTAATVA